MRKVERKEKGDKRKDGTMACIVGNKPFLRKKSFTKRNKRKLSSGKKAKFYQIKKGKGKKMIKKWTLLLEALMVASLVTMVLVGSAQAEAEGLKGMNIFMFLSYITLGLSLLLFFWAFVYLIKRRKAGIRIFMRKRRDREEEIIEMIRGIKELKRKIEERGENLTSLSDVFLTQISILSEINSMKTLVSFGLEVLVALSLAIISMLFVIISMI